MSKLLFSFLLGSLLLSPTYGESSGNRLSANGAHIHIELPTLHLGWRNGIPEPVIWDVKADEKEVDWISLISFTQDNAPLSRHLKVKGRLGGKLILENNSTIIRHVEKNGSNPEIHLQRRILGGRLDVNQIFTFTGEPYKFSFTIQLSNQSNSIFDVSPDDNITLVLGPGIGRQQTQGLGYAESIYSYVEPIALLNDEIERYRDHNIKITKLLLSDSEEIRWAGLHGRYFALIVAPAKKKGKGFESVPIKRLEMLKEDDAEEQDNIYSKLPTLELQLPVESISPKETLQWQFLVFSGPKTAEALKGKNVDFDQILFPGLWRWLRWLCFGLIWFMDTIHKFVPNWGLTIILLAVLVRIAMYPVAKNSLTKQNEFIAVQKRMLPELNIIKQKYKGEEQSERILQLYKKHGISPLAGLKPLCIVLLQLPILLALFHTLGSAYELRDAPFLWIETLALPDRLFHLGFALPVLGEYFNLLPILMALTTLITIKNSSAPGAGEAAQKRQNTMLVFMAIGFLVLFYPFPAGMVLYWTMANLLHLAQQKIVSNVSVKKDSAH